MSGPIANVYLCGASTHEGKLDLAADNLVWQSKNTEKRVTIPAGKIEKASWHDFGRVCQLWVYEGDSKLHRFDGLKAGEYERVAGHFNSAYKVKLAKRELSGKGRNFGTVRVAHGQLELVDDEGDLIAPLPLGSIGLAAVPGKNEVEIQCVDDDTAEREDECLVEMRFYVPPGMSIEGAPAVKKAAARGGAGASSSAADGADSENEEMADGDASGSGSAAHSLHALITEAAGIRGVTGDALVELPEEVGSFLVPRGRFAIDLTSTFMRLTGTSYEFKVMYKSIARITYLPLPGSSGTWADATRYAIVISLDDPLRQGNQRHAHLVLQLDAKPYDAQLRIPQADVDAGKYEGLGASGNVVSGELPKLVGSLLKKITGKPVFKPESFESANKQRAVRCTHKGTNGFLFPLDRSLMFIHKPTVWTRYSDVDRVELKRFNDGGVSASRTWDLHVYVRGSSGEAAREDVFQGIDRAERDPLVKFFEGRNIKVVEEAPARRGGKVDYAELDGLDEDDDEDDEEDEDFVSGSESSDDGDDDDEEEEDSDEDSGKKKKSSKKSSSSSKKDKKKEKKSREKSKKSSSKVAGKKRKRASSDDDEDDDED